MSIYERLFEKYEVSEALGHDRVLSAFVKGLLSRMVVAYVINPKCNGFRNVYYDLLGSSDEMKIVDSIIRGWLEPTFDGSTQARIEVRCAQIQLAVDWYGWRSDRCKSDLDKARAFFSSCDLDDRDIALGDLATLTETNEGLQEAKVALQASWKALKAAIVALAASEQLPLGTGQ